MGVHNGHRTWSPSRAGFPRILALSVFLVAASACSPDVTETDEYQALQAQLDDSAAELESTEGRLIAAEADLAEAETSLADAEAALGEAESELQRVQSDLSDARNEASEFQKALEDELNQPWPGFLKASFVEGCATNPDDFGLTVAQNLQVCECMVGELEGSIPLVDFLILSVSAVDPNVEINPVTGLPLGMDPVFMETIVDASTTCILDL